jgi:DNA-binding transcriptional ArsR family regulator
MDHTGIVVGAASRELRRILRPIEWVVLEDVALDARLDGKGDLVAPTSARRVAEHLGLTPGAVARALARLRANGLVTYARQAGHAGRFGLSAYVLVPVAGLDVIHVTDGDGAALRPAPPRLAPPRLAPPHIERPRAVDRHLVGGRPA